jgi:L-lactate dehydrogenase complex protein LldG
VVEDTRVSEARADILRRASAAHGAAPPVAARAYRRHGTLSPAERLRLFSERASDYGTNVRHSRDAGPTAGEICLAEGASKVAIPPGLRPQWRPSTLELVEDQGLTPRELAALDGVITGCTIAVAETGMIALSAGPEEGRRALTLVPDLHVCIVEERQIVDVLPEATDLFASRVAEGQPLTLIAGPSATSDIELKRVEGVHGPRRLSVIVLLEG